MASVEFHNSIMDSHLFNDEYSERKKQSPMKTSSSKMTASSSTKVVERLYEAQKQRDHQLERMRELKFKQETTPTRVSKPSTQQHTPIYKRLDQIKVQKQNLIEKKRQALIQQKEQERIRLGILSDQDIVEANQKRELEIKQKFKGSFDQKYIQMVIDEKNKQLKLEVQREAKQEVECTFKPKTNRNNVVQTVKNEKLILYQLPDTVAERLTLKGEHTTQKLQAQRHANMPSFAPRINKPLTRSVSANARRPVQTFQQKIKSEQSNVAKDQVVLLNLDQLGKLPQGIKEMMVSKLIK